MRAIQSILVLAAGLAFSASSIVTAHDQTAHLDHNPKHGGTFFMAMDNKHHLEGVLLAPGIFRVYLYDDHTKPLSAEETRKAGGTVQIGESGDAPKISLAPGMKKETLEARLGNEVKFPVIVTLLLRLPGMAPNARPEVFTFRFAQFTEESAAGGCGSLSSMPNVHC